MHLQSTNSRQMSFSSFSFKMKYSNVDWLALPNGSSLILLSKKQKEEADILASFEENSCFGWGM
jgi:hypothetical protein